MPTNSNFSLEKNTEIIGQVIAVADFVGDGTHDLLVRRDLNLHFYLGSKSSTTFTESPLTIKCTNRCVYAHFGHFAGKPYDNPLNLLVTEQDNVEYGVFHNYFYRVKTRPKSKGKKAEFELYEIVKAPLEPLTSRSLLMLVDFYSKMQINFVGMDVSNRLSVWSFGDETSGNWKIEHLDTDCKLAPFHQSHYVDLNGDLFPDIVFVCSSSSSPNAYLEYWMNEALSSKVPRRQFVRQTEISSSSRNSPVKDKLEADVKSLKIFDVFGNGINHLVVGTDDGVLRIFPNKIHFCTSASDSKCFYYKSIGQLSISQEEFVVYGFDTNIEKAKSLSVGNGNSIVNIQFADVNLDSYLDVVVLLGNNKFRFLIFNPETRIYELLEDPTLTESYALPRVRNVGFIHIDPNPAIDLILNVEDLEDVNSRVYILANKSSFDSFFIRLYPSDVSYGSIQYGRFSPPIPGHCVSFAVQLTGSDSNEGSYQRIDKSLSISGHLQLIHFPAFLQFLLDLVE